MCGGGIDPLGVKNVVTTLERETFLTYN